jgi:hypothetical protein
LRRIARQIGYREAMILSRPVESIAAHTGESSWKSEDVALKLRERGGAEPNQITFGTAFVGLSVTLLYATGYLWIGALLALAVGVLDGVGHLEEIAGPCDVDLNVLGNSGYLGCLGYGRTWTAGSFCEKAPATSPVHP